MLQVMTAALGQFLALPIDYVFMFIVDLTILVLLLLKVLQEALRMYPPATAIARSSPPDLIVCGKNIPAGRYIVVIMFIFFQF